MRGHVEVENLAIRHVKFWTHSSCSWSARSNLILLVSSNHTLKAMMGVSSKFYWSIPKLPASREQSSDWAFSSEWGPFNVEFELPQCGALWKFYLSLSLYCSDLCSQTYSSEEVKRGKMPRQSFHTCVSFNFHKFSWKLPFVYLVTCGSPGFCIWRGVEIWGKSSESWQGQLVSLLEVNPGTFSLQHLGTQPGFGKVIFLNLVFFTFS